MTLGHSVWAAIAVLGLGACAKQAAPPPPPPEVGVVRVQATTVPITRELVGRLSATRTAEVRARIPGIVQKRIYTEGSDVAEGEVLFLVDPAPLQAALNARQAALGQARANAVNAQTKAQRYQELASKGVIAKQDLDDANAQQRSTAAAVKQAQADVESAQLNLGYARVVAPIAGRAGRALVTEGALVGQGEATPLTTVEQIDPIYVDFSQSVSELNDLRRAQSAGKLTLASKDQVEVQVMLADGTAYPHAAALGFSDLAVDPKTGSVSLRATVPNPEHSLLPGMFVKIHLTQGELAQAWMIPQRSIQRDAQGAYAMVAAADGKVTRKNLELGQLLGSDWVVLTGLVDGDQVIVSGLQKIPSDAPVKPIPQEQLDHPAAAPSGAATPAKS
ncbi:MAG: efflux RND transporter periplasmic adaptor subunit [Tahibacter sp.]